MLLTANVGVALIENSSGREAETAGLRAAAPPHIQQPSHLCHDGRVKVKVLYHVVFSPELKSSARCYLGLFVTVIQRGATLHFRGRRLCLLFGVYIHSADLRAKRAHQFPPSASCCSSSHALAFRRTLACDGNPVPFPVLRRERWGSSWTDIWTSAATAARTVAVASATAAATTSPWVASTLGRTTTKAGESFVTLSCRATGGSHGCWAGSEEHCLGFQPSLSVQIIPLIYISDHM